MRTTTVSTIRSAGRFMLNFVWTAATATYGQGRRVLMYLAERVRLSRRVRAVERAGLALGAGLCEQRRGDEDLLREIALLDEASSGPTRNASRSRAQRQKENLLGRLAASTLRMAEPPPGVGATYRDFRRALAAVREARQRIAAARSALWPRDLREWLHIGFGATTLATVLVGLALVLAPSGSRPAVLPSEVADEKSRPVAEVPGTWGPVKGVSNKTDTDDSPNGDEKPQRPMRQERNDSDPKGDAQVTTKQRPSLVVQLGHTGQVASHSGILSLAFSPDGRQIVTGSTDNTARLWDVASGREIRAFLGHTSDVRSVAFSPDGNQVLTASGDGTLRFWSADTGTLTRVINGQFFSAVVSPDGRQVLTAGDGVRLWDAATGNEIRALQTSGHIGAKRFTLASIVYSAAFSPDGKQVLAAGRKTRLWDAASGKELHVFPVAAGSVAFSPDGKQVLTAGLALQLWDAVSGKEIRCFQKKIISSDELAWIYGSHTTHIDYLHRIPATRGSAAFSPDGKQVITTIGRKAFKWDIASGERRCIFEDDTPDYRDGSLHPMRLAVVFSRDGKQMLVDKGPRTAVLLDAVSGKEVGTFEGRADSITGAAFTPDGWHVVVKTTFGTTIWDRANAKKLRDLNGPWDLITETTPKLPRRVLIDLNENRRSIAEATPIPASQRMAVSPDLKQIATLEVLLPGDRNNVRLWDTATGKVISTFPLDFPKLRGQLGNPRVSDVRNRAKINSPKAALMIRCG